MRSQLLSAVAAIATVGVLAWLGPSAHAQVTYPGGYDPQSGQTWDRDIRYDPVLNPFGMRDWQYNELFNTGRSYYYGRPNFVFLPPANYNYGAYSPSRRAPDNSAHIRLIVPPDAKVWFGNSATQQTGSTRFFQSPPLTPGKDYGYDVKVQWRDANGNEVTQTRHVDVRANTESTVDLTRANPSR
jgi:uncharacterized protein (TIGR03000 family)